MRVEPFSLPLSRPLETAAGPIETRRGFVVRTTATDAAGTGEATPLAGWTEPFEACERALASVDADPNVDPNVDPDADADPGSTLDAEALSAAPAARHGLSLAVLDAAARAADRPLYRHLGGPERATRVPVNATVGDGSPAETAASCADAVDAGYPAVKLKIGARSIEADLARIEAARERCPDVELRLDANGAWDADTAASALPRLEALDVAVLEQPLPATALSAHARLRGRSVDIALDESVVECGPAAIRSADAADVLVCKPMALGGVDRARRVAEAALSRGTDVVITTTIDGAIARAAAVHLAASLPDVRACGLATGGLLAADLRAGIAPIEEGAALVPQGKGNIPPG
ncbi:mandelate racemase/muconate lactonizing enzyme family protein [Natronomonas sp.]|uniref:mandelate racemase/muconate lactonizing enzyme family protein n=1 Tax=Natronomonas sp. TaxID=2184060 RepID=UPI00260B3F40|nr:enolase C-terminal domain-like protein [Natronomonas sp.]